MKRNRKWIVAGIVIVTIGVLVKGCFQAVDHEIRKSTSVVEVVQDELVRTYDVEGKVVAKHTIRVPLNGTWTKLYVKEGDEVKKGQKLAKATGYGNEEIIKAPQAGIVYEIDEQQIVLAEKGVYLAFYVNQAMKERLEVGMTVSIRWQDRVVSLIVREIAASAVYQKQDNHYLVRAEMPEGNWDYGMEIHGELEWGVVERAVLIPLEATVQVNDQVYVIYESWLDHPIDLRAEDYEAVTVIDAADGMVCLADMPRQSRVLRFDDTTYPVIYELCRQLTS